MVYVLAMNLSKFGEKFTRKAGITELMDDLGAAVANGDMLMLGGGNTAFIAAPTARGCRRGFATRAHVLFGMN